MKLSQDYVLVLDEQQIPAQASELDRKSTRLNSSHSQQSRMPSSAWKKKRKKEKKTKKKKKKITNEQTKINSKDKDN